ncbi:MAG: 1,4-alpha-glucan branching protein GlgB [Oscillospiraceae bacterium]|nr:1,4-alpha-glucan branching protein GlgB [Oscillospiraceae bacterium]
MELQDFYMGRAFDIYRHFGVHAEWGGFRFRIWAPAARRVTVTGACNGWNESELYREGSSGIFSAVLPAAYGQLYKYRIYTPDGGVTEHCDPCGFAMELRPGACSVIVNPDGYQFHDDQWMARRSAAPDRPLNIYEVHLGSWRRKPDGSWYRYDEIAGPLIDYALQNGYTHIEFLPLSEHPFDGSWGYQNTGFFAPTSRYGNPDQLKELVDRCHQAGLGVLMDFVPVHFAVDSYGLRTLDGTSLYEYPHRDVGESEWGSLNFIHSRREVACFLQSAAHYWLEEFHFDGLRMDAVSRLIYWQGDPARGENGAALAFLRNMNRGLKALHPTALLIAEDSTTYSGTTRPVEEGGLGFDYKWDLGWMHDTLSFFQTGPAYRTENYHRLTFSMLYFYNERHLLPLSHDEVVHGKAAVLQKMAGYLPDKLPQARCLYLYMMMHPGKKLSFMGNELGQLREWSEERQLDWELLENPAHRQLQDYLAILWGIYRQEEALHRDSERESFCWLDCAQETRCIYALQRKSGQRRLQAVLNLSDQLQENYLLCGPELRPGKVLLHTDWIRFGGRTAEGSEPLSWSRTGESWQLKLTLPPFSGILIQADT